MDSKRRWLGWIALGIGGIALLVALFGSRFGPQSAAGWNESQAHAQQGQVQAGNGPQSGAANQGANAQPGMRQRGNGQQGGATGPGANAQPGASQQANGSQTNNAGRGADARHGSGRAGDGGFGLGSWLHLPFKLIGRAFQLAMLALLVLLGFWFIRGRATGSKPVYGQAAPAQAPPQGAQSPTGESYSDESSYQE